MVYFVPHVSVFQVVKPLCELLHPDIEGKPNYDALLALTNLVRLFFSLVKLHPGCFEILICRLV